MFTLTKRPTFPFGRLLMTPGVLELADELGAEAVLAGPLSRHLSRDWGDLDESDRKANDQALGTGERILSAYKVRRKEVGFRQSTPTRKVWVITEADRSATTVLLPDEY